MILFFLRQSRFCNGNQSTNHTNHNNLRSIFFTVKCLILANHKNHENLRSIPVAAVRRKRRTFNTWIHKKISAWQY